jgi:hypothetical protein
VTEAKWEVMQYILKEHNFQDAFKKWQMHWERCIQAEGTFFTGDSGQLAQG